MTDIHQAVLQIFFWSYIDVGTLPKETPLFLGFYDEEPIEDVIAEHFNIPHSDAKNAIEAARQEVAL